MPRHDVAGRPFIVIWETTRACPLACRHCRAEAQPDRNPGELSTEEGCRLIDEIAAFGHPAPLFVLTGGDPFQRPDLAELVAHAHSAGVPVAVSPSGTPTLTRDNLTLLRDAGATALSLSVDGATAETHDGFRGVPGVFDWTLGGWRMARELGLRVQVNTTVGRHNLTELPAIARLVLDHGAMTWSAFFLVPTGRGRALEALDPQTVEDVMNALYDAGAALPVKTTEGHHFRRVVVQRQVLERRGEDHVAVLGLGPLYEQLRDGLRQQGVLGAAERPHRPPMNVNAGRGFVFVSHTGTVHPSGFLPVSAGSVREAPLGEIYRTSPLLSALRDPGRLQGRCGACEFADLCGGSRSRAFALYGDPHAEEPWCAYEPGSFPYPDDVHLVLAGG